MQHMTISATLLAGSLLVACAGVNPADEDDTTAALTPSSFQPMQHDEAAAPSNDAQLKYWGGPVLSSVNVHAVYWNAQVKYRSQLDGFYQAVTQSEYFDWLDEYDTPDQHIGRGSFAGSIVDTQPSGDLTDRQIEDELARLIDAHKLPAPAANDLYMVHFPPGATITDGGGNASCQAFCAYHGTFKHKGKSVYYGVIPDLGGACGQGCGSKSQLENTTTASSHELIEAVTDAAVGLAQSLGPPLAWYDENNGEIGDICVGQDATVAGYTVQREWSNAAGACIATKGTSCGCHGRQCGDDGCGNSCGTCSADSSCGDDGQCGGTGGGCGEMEPNDSAAHATAICSTGTMSGSIGKAGDVDWYRWTVPKGARYVVTLAHRSGGADMTLYHASASGRLTRVDSASDGGNADEQFAHRSKSGGTYLVKVLSAKGGTSSMPYSLTAQVNP